MSTLGHACNRFEKAEVWSNVGTKRHAQGRGGNTLPPLATTVLNSIGRRLKTFPRCDMTIAALAEGKDDAYAGVFPRSEHPETK